ncbi:MAG: UvrD-helicase domain-containing protein, partial [Eubacterium sp.]|nr:UvrD-helicase domain-containing protein [Eubacterium sp.]
LIPTANISTVHSFCNYIIGQYFHRIGLDPSYTQGTEEELTLIKNRVMDKLLEDKYSEADDDFMRLAGLRALNRSDVALSEWVLGMYERSVGEPFPDIAFDMWESEADKPIDDDSEILKEVINREYRMASALLQSLEPVENAFIGIDKKYDDTMAMMKADITGIKDACEAFSDKNITATICYDNIESILRTADYPDLAKSAPKLTEKEAADPVKKENKEKKITVWRQLNSIRSQLFSDRDEMFFQCVDKHEEDRKAMKETMHSLIMLTKEFSAAYSEAKRELGVVDFSDLEQFALQILFDRDEETGARTRSEVARELSEYFEEIMIDEYQDSNRIQDTILWSVSKCEEKDGLMPWESFASNRFMVGDIKQSIYRFRNACPELFEEKLKAFSQEEDAPHRRIDLHKNFRSADIVIDSTNEVFKAVMHDDIGGVVYDEDALLHRGREIPEESAGGASSAEHVGRGVSSGSVSSDLPVAEKVYLYDVKADLDRIGLSKDGAAAYAIAQKIEEIVHGDSPIYIFDEDRYRRVSYRDIVILTRALKPIAYEYMDVFRLVGVPFVTELNQGFYGSREVSVILNMLNIVDNPRQDIPLAAVLLSPMFGFSEGELSLIRSVKRRGDLIDALREYRCLSDVHKIDIDIDLGEKVDSFITFLESLRADMSYVPAADIAGRIYRETGIYNYFENLYDGDRRCANLDYLMHLITGTAGSEMSLHAFVEHMAELAETKADMGEAMVHGEGEDVVRLMSVHKSKGLEFPVVILTRTESEGRKSDAGRWLYDSDFGVGGYADDIDRGIEKKTLIWHLIHRKNSEDDLGEILRLLYVALTRARDQLILVSVNRDEEMSAETDYFHRLKMKSFISMIEPAVAADIMHRLFVRETVEYTDEDDVPVPVISSVYSDGKESQKDSDTYGDYNTEVYRKGNETETMQGSAGADVVTDDSGIASGCVDLGSEKTVYPTKVSVSELKKASMMSEDETESVADLISAEGLEESVDVTGEAGPASKGSAEDKSHRLGKSSAEDKSDRTFKSSPEDKPAIKRRDDETDLPLFMRESKKKKYTAAERGTITHHIMATIDFTAFDGMEAAGDDEWSDRLTGELDLLVDREYLPEAERHIADESAIIAFFKSGLGQRMIAAAVKELLHREQQFTLSVPLTDVYPEAVDEPEDTTVMIQGVIDAFFEEGDGVVLMDYKTDRVTNGGRNSESDAGMEPAEILKERYATQLEWYRR